MIKEEGKHYLYRHIRPDINQVFYVGVGTKCKFGTFEREHSRAYQKCNRNAHWKNIVNLNPNYIIEIMFYSDDYLFLLNKEIEFIKIYGRKNKKEGELCNETDGGEGTLGSIKSEETRRKMSQRSKGRKIDPDIIRKTVAEKKKRAAERGFWACGAEKRKGVKKPNHPNCVKAAKEKCSIKVKQFKISGEFIKIWDSMADAERSLINKTTGKISMVCNGKRPSAYGYIWRFESDNFDKYEYKPRGNKNIVEINKAWKLRNLNR